MLSKSVADITHKLLPAGKSCNTSDLQLSVQRALILFVRMTVHHHKNEQTTLLRSSSICSDDW